MLVGHGSYDGEAYKLNLPGPDIDGDEMAKLLAAVPARSQLVVNATSASGSILEKWKADGRTVITATRSGFERNATRFAQHFAAALAAGSADINKNGAITAQEVSTTSPAQRGRQFRERRHTRDRAPADRRRRRDALHRRAARPRRAGRACQHGIRRRAPVAARSSTAKSRISGRARESASDAYPPAAAAARSARRSASRSTPRNRGRRNDDSGLRLRARGARRRRRPKR
jgi:hypothetical protein